VRQQRQETVSRARQILDAICASIDIECSLLGDRLAELAEAPFEAAIDDLAVIDKKTQVDSLAMRLNARLEASVSKATSLLEREIQEIERKAIANLEAEFGEQEFLQLLSPSSRLPMTQAKAIELGVSGVDAGSVGLAAGAGALVGGTIAGGTGMALIAMGPIGWIAGAALGALVAGSGVLAGTAMFTESDRRGLAQTLTDRQEAASQQARSLADRSGRSVRDAVRTRERSFAADAFQELDAISHLLDNEARMSDLASKTRSLRRELERLDLS